MRRAFLVALALAAVFAGPQLASGHACTNEGHAVTMVNPTNGIPAGWRWDTALPSEPCA